MTNANWKTLSDRAYRNAVEHGFHKGDESNEHYLCLVISELMEAVEADRKGKRADRKKYQDKVNYFLRELHYYGDQLLQVQKEQFEHLIKDSVEDELADACIRALDLAGKCDCGEFLDQHPNNKVPIIVERTFTETMYKRCFYLSNPLSTVDVKLRGLLYFLVALAKDKLGCDLLWYIQEKMWYNENREMLHGKKY